MKKKWLQILLIIYVVYHWMTWLFYDNIFELQLLQFGFPDDLFNLGRPFAMCSSWMIILSIFIFGLIIIAIFNWIRQREISFNSIIRFPLMATFILFSFDLFTTLIQVNHLNDVIYENPLYGNNRPDKILLNQFLTDKLIKISFVILTIYAFRSYEAIPEKKHKVLRTGRFKNRIIDFICIWIFTFQYENVFMLNKGWLLESIAWINSSPYYFFILYSFVYYLLTEYTFAQTPGKLIGSNYVSGLEKNRFKTVLIRTLCRFIPLEGFSFFGMYGKGWHDKLSKTSVIKGV